MRYFPHQQLDVLFRILAVGNVDHDVGDPQGPAVGIAREHPAASRYPQHGSVGPYDPIFGGIEIFLVGRLVKFRHHVAIFRMQRALELVVIAADLSAAIGQVQPEQGHALLGPDPGARHHVGFPGGECGR